MPRRSLRLLHTADVHLEPRSSASVDSSAYEAAFETTIDLALEERVDGVLIAGDLFDSNRIDDEQVRFVVEQLSRLDCATIFIPGNHDCFDADSIYRRHDLRQAGPHVHPLTDEDGETLYLKSLGLTVWGKGLVEHDPRNRPLEGVPRRRDNGWYIGLAHGYCVADRRELRSSLITPDEIADSGLDYLALGHVHVFREVSVGDTCAYYPGAPYVPYKPDNGQVALVTLDEQDGVQATRRLLRATSARSGERSEEIRHPGEPGLQEDE